MIIPTKPPVLRLIRKSPGVVTGSRAKIAPKGPGTALGSELIALDLESVRKAG